MVNDCLANWKKGRLYCDQRIQRIYQSRECDGPGRWGYHWFGLHGDRKILGSKLDQPVDRDFPGEDRPVKLGSLRWRRPLQVRALLELGHQLLDHRLRCLLTGEGH